MASSSTGNVELGLWHAIALVVGHTIGIGIFLTPAELIGALASPAVTLGLWIGCGALVLAGALTFGELAARYPVAGGLYVYLREGWSERVAFLYGWQSMLVMDPGVAAALATGLAGYAAVLWPAAQGSERWIAIAVIWLLAIAGMTGLRLSAGVLAAITALKFLAFAGIVALAFGAANGSWSHFEPLLTRHANHVPFGEAIGLGIVGVFFSYGGFWEASRIAGEIRNAPRTMPIALTVGVAAVTVIYVATTIAFIYVVPPGESTSASVFARHAAEGMLGPKGPLVLAAVVALSVVASLLALLIMAPRLYMAMNCDGLFPSALAVVAPATNAPVRATIVLAALASLYAAIGTFQGILAFFMCTTLVFVAMAAGALLIVRRDASKPGGVATAGGAATPVLFILLVSTVVLLIAFSRPMQALAGLAVVLVGVPVHARLARSIPVVDERDSAGTGRSRR